VKGIQKVVYDADMELVAKGEVVGKLIQSKERNLLNYI